MDLNCISSNLSKIYKENGKNCKELLGVVYIKLDDSCRLEIILSRSFSRDKHLRLKGHGEFDLQQYTSNLSSKLLILSEFNSNEIAKKLSNTSNLEVVNSTENEIDDEIVEDFELQDTNTFETDTNDFDEMQTEMIRLGFPIEFGSKKDQVSHSKTKKREKQDMLEICNFIQMKVVSLIKNPDKLISYWIDYLNTKPTKSYPSFVSRCFYQSLLNSELIKKEVKSDLEKLFANTTFSDKNCQSDLIASFKGAIYRYWQQKFFIWIQKMNLSKSYWSSCRNHPDFQVYLERLFSLIGLTYQSISNTELSDHKSVFIYPVFGDKSIAFCERHGFNLSRSSGEIADEQIWLATSTDEDSKLLNKYYFQRYRFFERFDQGILLDKESWYSVTPGVLAQHVALRFQQKLISVDSNDNLPVIIDGFCGVGGNAIRFAESGFIVLAVDMDCNKLKLLMHNASVYGVHERIVPVCCDFYHLDDWISSDKCHEELRGFFSRVLAIHMSPPWGGPECVAVDVFDMDLMEFDKLMQTASKLSKNISCFMPRQINCSQFISCLARSENESWAESAVEIEQNCLEFKVKGISIYTGLLTKFPDSTL